MKCAHTGFSAAARKPPPCPPFRSLLTCRLQPVGRSRPLTFAEKNMDTSYHILMKQILPWCFLASIISPVIFIVGYPVGFVARESKLAPRLGLTVIIQTTLLLLTCMGVCIWFSIFPAAVDTIMNPYSVYMISGGPQTILAFMIIIVTIGTMIRQKRKHSEQASPKRLLRSAESPEP